MSSSKDAENQMNSKVNPETSNMEQEQLASGNTGNKWQKLAERARLQEEEEANQANDELEESDELEQQPQESIEYTSRGQLEDQMTALEMKCGEYKSQLDRAQAELANMHRRSARDIESAHHYGVSKLINELLPVADSLSRGLEGVKEDNCLNNDPKLKAMYEGMKLTLDLLHSTLAKFGVTVICPEKGDSFNPDLHEAVSAYADPSVAPNSILQVLQTGYKLRDRVLRAAMVIVAK